MHGPYPGELRTRVIDFVEEGGSRREAAEQFDVSVSSAIRWVQRFRENGTFEPMPSGGSTSPLEKHSMTPGGSCCPRLAHDGFPTYCTDIGIMLLLRLAMIQTEPVMTRKTISTPKASARILFVLSDPLPRCRKKTRWIPICAKASTTNPTGIPGGHSKFVCDTTNEAIVSRMASASPAVYDRTLAVDSSCSTPGVRSSKTRSSPTISRLPLNKPMSALRSR